MFSEPFCSQILCTIRLDPNILWFLYCTFPCSLCQNMLVSMTCMIVSINTQTMCLPLCQATGLSVWSTCLHTYVHVHHLAFQVDCIWSCLVLLVFSFPQASMLYAHIGTIMSAQICTHRWCTHRRGHARTYLLIMSARICTHTRGHAHTYLLIMSARICTHTRYHACTYLHT